jgi:enamine deaminase RidA (YjgF/YER057c/UK114 family)
MPMSRLALRALTALLLYAGLAACAQKAPEEPLFERYSPEGLADSQKLWNYSQVIATRPGARTVYVAGTVGDDAEGRIVPPDNFDAQVDRTFANIRRSLEAAGAKGGDVVQLRLYIVGFDGEKHWPAINKAMKATFGERGPTATMIGVQALAYPDILFEADVVAVAEKP